MLKLNHKLIIILDYNAIITHFIPPTPFTACARIRSAMLTTPTAVQDIVNEAIHAHNMERHVSHLDRFAQSYPCHHHTRPQDIVNEDSGALDMETFLPLLQERVYTEDPNNRQFIVSWIQVC